jgi:hypothetical protein
VGDVHTEISTIYYYYGGRRTPLRSSYVILCHPMSSYVILCHPIFILFHLMSSYDILWHLMTSYVISCRLMSSYFILCHLMPPCDIPFAPSHISYILQLPTYDTARLSNFLTTHWLTYLLTYEHLWVLEGPSALKIIIRFIKDGSTRILFFLIFQFCKTYVIEQYHCNALTQFVKV